MATYFGPFVVSRQVFYRSAHSFALVNLKPLLPGHVMVCPHRVVPRLKDLSTEEVSDLFITVQKVSAVIEEVYHGQSLNIAIQDGALAGQSVPHVHCHIIPRKLSDLPDVDDIYKLMSSPDADLELSFAQLKKFSKSSGASDGPDLPDDLRQPRGMDEMEAEAIMLRGRMERRGASL
ncbi:HIT-like domain-containing protein [Kockiozyma suomiensis]|uniref:HIT-like domain-containing protein n=1 Tax=Kockiozyma suomiensis TaxID=1337062 RepID=UPI00334351B1